MWRKHLNPLHWSISTKLAAIFLITVLIPAVIVITLFSNYRRGISVREQNEVRLDTLGALEAARMEQVLQGLTTGIERLLADRVPLEEYLRAASTRNQDEAITLARETIWDHVARYTQTAPSLSRVRFYSEAGLPLVDIGATGDAISLTEDGAFTPADDRINQGSLDAWATVSDIYPGETGSPSIDVIFAIRPVSDITGNEPVAGYIVFTQDLTRAGEDGWLPSLYAAVQDFPKVEEETHVFLLNREGQLISPASEWDIFADATSSAGTHKAQLGDVGVFTYHSPFLKTEVMGYTAMTSFPDGPTVIFLVETPTSVIDQQIYRGNMITLGLIVGGVFVFGVIAVTLASVSIARPVSRLTDTARQLAVGRMGSQVPVMARRDEIGTLNNTLVSLADQLFNAITELERRVVERTRNLEITLEIGRVLTSIHDLDTLLEEVVNLINDRFGTIYHVQIFLVDSRTNRANLRASTGTAGRRLLQRGHYLEVGSQSVIGSVTLSGHAVVALDTSSNPIHRRNEFLPDTRAEMALPLRSGDRVIGALDLQSTLPDAFSEQDVELFQGMADQITIAIENAMLFAESNTRLQEIERLNRSLTRAGWRDVELRRGQAALRAVAGLATGGSDWTDLQREAMRTGQVAEHHDGDVVVFAVPVMLRDEVLGAVEWQVPKARYTQAVRHTAEELTTRLALTAENLRLSEQSRQTAQREFWVNQISSKLVGTTDIDQILQTAVHELGLVLRVPQAAIQLFAPLDNPAAESGDAASE